eukprot:TRINITY_DN60926_c0_g1_i1.p1 TRINITY_DN60926_c0_g1~~TRINITY_DN60926_c0_g1_i1.p1  ORF type:complete len:490 (+),score=83.07 TRINITY_DN60926_c0_g1_i1:73-1470(+)
MEAAATERQGTEPLRSQKGGDAEPLSEAQVAAAMRANPQVRKHFNTWLVGGTYSQRRLLAARPPPLPRSEGTEKVKSNIGHLRQRLVDRSRKERRQNSARNRVPPLRLRLGDQTKSPRRAAESAEASGEHPATSRRAVAVPAAKPVTRPATAPRPPASSPRQLELQAQQHPRAQLKSSLVDHASHSSYISMFPPLFTPYDRAAGSRMMRGWGSGVQEYYRDIDRMAASGPSPNPEPAPAPSRAGILAQQTTRVKRPRGLAGQPGFYPTGTTATAWRVFTNWRLAMEGDQEEHERQGLERPSGSASRGLRMLKAQHRKQGSRPASGAGPAGQQSPQSRLTAAMQPLPAAAEPAGPPEEVPAQAVRGGGIPGVCGVSTGGRRDSPKTGPKGAPLQAQPSSKLPQQTAAQPPPGAQAAADQAAPAVADPAVPQPRDVLPDRRESVGPPANDPSELAEPAVVPGDVGVD